MWSNKEMSESLDDWHEESSVEASRITINDDPAVLRVLEDSGLLCKPRDSEEAAARQQGLNNLIMHQPTPCASGEDVVYVVARKKFRHPKAWMLAVEMKDEGKLRDVGYDGNLSKSFVSAIYCPSRISKHLRPKKFKIPATTPVDMDAEESDEAGGLELIMME